MKNIIQFLSIIFLGISLVSCEKEVKFNLDNKEEAIVLNAFLKKDSTVAARVSFLKGLNQKTNLEPNNAVVNLYENDVFVETLQPSTIGSYKYYVSQKQLSTGKQYKLTVEVAGFDKVEGSDFIPEMPQASGDGKLFVTSSANEGDVYNLHFDLQNTSTAKSYYRIKVMSWYRTWTPTNPDTLLYRQAYFSFKNADMGETSIDGYSETYEEYYFTNEVFNGNSSKEIQLKLYPNFGGVGSDTATYTLEVTSLTEASFNYLKTKSDAKYNNNDPFTEPSVIYSNIKNGLGIVGGIAHLKIPYKL